MHQKITFPTKIIRNVKIDDILISVAVPQVSSLGALLTSRLLHADSPDVVPWHWYWHTKLCEFSSQQFCPQLTGSGILHPLSIDNIAFLSEKKTGIRIYYLCKNDGG